MDMVAEIISRVERRRQWSPEQKVKILTEALAPGAKVPLRSPTATVSAAASSMPGRDWRKEGAFPAFP